MRVRGRVEAVRVDALLVRSIVGRTPRPARLLGVRMRVRVRVGVRDRVRVRVRARVRLRVRVRVGGGARVEVRVSVGGPPACAPWTHS